MGTMVQDFFYSPIVLTSPNQQGRSSNEIKCKLNKRTNKETHNQTHKRRQCRRRLKQFARSAVKNVTQTDRQTTDKASVGNSNSSQDELMQAATDPDETADSHLPDALATANQTPRQ